MARFILVVDALRYDATHHYQERFGGTLHKVDAVASWTEPVFRVFQTWMRAASGTKCFCTSGYPVKNLRWDDMIDYLERGSMYPLFAPPRLVVALKEAIPQRYDLMVVHEYYVHNYWEEINIWPTNLKVSQKNRVWKDYMERVRLLGDKFEEEYLPLLRDSQYEIFVTSDHGEAFWEDGVHWHHGQEGYNGGMCPGGNTVTKEVMEIPILDFQNYDEEVTQEKIFTGYQFGTE